MNHLCTLITAELAQKTGFTTGGNQPHPLVDTPLARDGLGRPVIRGSSLAGAFISTAKKYLGRELPKNITLAEEHTPSCWRFEHSHLLESTFTNQFRQHVAINAATGAAEDNSLFNLEAVAAGQNWGFCMEFVPSRHTKLAEQTEQEALLIPVLTEWSNPSGCRLGRGASQGYGWMQLKNIKIWRLDKTALDFWPNSTFSAEQLTPQALEAYLTAQGLKPLCLDTYRQQFAATLQKLNPQPASVVEITGQLSAGERQDDDGFGAGYGLDSLSVGGHASLQHQAADFFELVNSPTHVNLNKDNFKPDFLLTSLTNKQGELKPFIPGSSIKGAWRTALERHFYHCDEAQKEVVKKLLGSEEQAGKLSISDAYIQDEFVLAWLNHVAIDEFSGGVYGSGKFDRLALLEANFNWQARIDAQTDQEAKQLKDLIDQLLQALGATANLPIGGGVWRGHGHLRWHNTRANVRRLGEKIEETAGEEL